MGKVILWPAAREAIHRPDGDTEGYDLTGATLVDVVGGFSWVGRCVDWATLSIVDDLAGQKAALRDAVCERAEAVRNQFLTPGSGQAITYTRKEGEARAWVTGADPDTAPFLAAEAAATGTTIDALAAIVIAQADAWVAAGAAIEARRRGLLVEIEAAVSADEIAAIDVTTGWPGQAA